MKSELMPNKVDHHSLPSLLRPLRHLSGGQIRFEGELTGTVGNVSDIACTVTVTDRQLFKLILQQGVLGAAEAYLRGYWHSNDLVALVRILVLNRDLLDRLDQNPIARLSQFFLRLWHSTRRNSRDGSQKNIADHYDLSNDFFKLFLDDSMMYSSAVFDTPNMSLEVASNAKKEMICQKLQLKPFDKLVEIGSGWGGFAIYAAKHYGCHVTTITISQAQYDEACARVKQAGLEHRIEVRLQDYRDLYGKFDKLVSIEMIEAVGAQYLPIYFAKCQELLKHNGLALIQAITIEDSRYHTALQRVDYIKRYIFPGSFIPCVSVLTEQAAKQGLKLHHLQDIGQSYALTIHHWRQKFLQARAEVLELGFDERFIRLWDFYLCYCEGGFMEGVISDVHLLFQASMQPYSR
jgi:cyclopropane-fatty-acyl-phospholipid synthase